MSSDPLPSRTLKLTLEYDGTAYSGWQRQKNAPSVQQTLEEALRQMTRETELTVRGAGRTDAGVHALGQVASFRTATGIPVQGFLRGLNSLLPGDIGIRACDEAAPDFDARRHARGKHYRYRILNRPEPSPLRDRYVWHIPWPRLSASAMHEAAAPLRGRHDFAAFRAADCERKNTMRELFRLDVSAKEDELVIDVEGTAFLKHMVRVLVGTLVRAGQGKLDAPGVASIRDSGNRTRAGMTAPPQGLYLVCVLY